MSEAEFHSTQSALTELMQGQNRKPGIIRKLSSFLRVLPDFIIIGGQRCGTTSLFNNLVKHPSIARPFKKEIRFFGLNYRNGTNWYRAHFPSVFRRFEMEGIRKRGFVTGEATPYYIFHPDVPRRVSQTLGNVKIIAILRNPVDRAYSHYHLEVRQGYERLSFEEAIDCEEQRLKGEEEKLLRDEDYVSFQHAAYSYLSRGIYIDQLERWTKFFPKENFLILKSEDFYHDASQVLANVLDFLGLPKWAPRRYEVFKAPFMKEYRMYEDGVYPGMDPNTRDRLIDYFAQHNRRLFEFLGRSYDWEK
jgi:Sulfotransferase domain